MTDNCFEPAQRYLADCQAAIAHGDRKQWCKPGEWPIENAIACLKEARDRAKACWDADHADTWHCSMRLSMDYAIEVVKAINSLKEPEPVNPERVARQAVRNFVKEFGRSIEQLGIDISQEDFGDE